MSLMRDTQTRSNGCRSRTQGFCKPNLQDDCGKKILIRSVGPKEIKTLAFFLFPNGVFYSLGSGESFFLKFSSLKLVKSDKAFTRCIMQLINVLRDSVEVRAFLLALVLSVRGYRRRSLSRSGALAAFGVGFLVSCCGATSTAALLSFFFTGTYLTKVGAAVKRTVEQHYAASGHRSGWQVLCNGGVAAALAFAVAVNEKTGGQPTAFTRKALVAILAQLSALQADTWSSELGVLSAQQPRLIVGLRPVPRGTNGAVTIAGLGAAFASGVCSGVVCAAVAAAFPRGASGLSTAQIFCVCVTAAVGGSAVDSVLGQFLQETVQRHSGHIADGKEVADDRRRDDRHVSGVNVLSNNGVNALTSVIVGAVAWVAMPWSWL